MCDKELLERIENKDINAFNQFYNKYWRLIYRWTSNRIGDREQVKDILQNYWIDIWTKPSIIKVDQQNSAKNILLGFISFRILDFFKRKEVVALSDILCTEDALENSYCHVWEELEMKEVHSIINNILMEIPSLDRDIYLLREVENNSVREISQKLSVTEETVRRKLALTNKVLQQKLSKYYIGEANILIFICCFAYFLSTR